jgi:hypothetical protein
MKQAWLEALLAERMRYARAANDSEPIRPKNLP